MSNELKVAIEAVKAGAEKALEHFSNIPPVEMKADNTPVTIADKETEVVIKEVLLKTFPDAKFVGEEMGGDPKEDTFWIIDPIDGTKAFIRSIGFWAVLLALCKKGEIVAGVSYMPLIDELLYAEKDSGAFLNGKKVHVSNIPKLKEAYMCYSDLLEYKTRDAVIALMDACWVSRGMGDAFSYHLVATGRVELFTEPSPSLWDVAPFKVIIKEAGGKLTTLTGEGPFTGKVPILASNGFVHEEAIAILNGKD